MESLSDSLVAQAQRFAPERCTSRDECYRLTRDTSESVRLMASGQRDPGLLDTARITPWLSARGDA